MTLSVDRVNGNIYFKSGETHSTQGKVTPPEENSLTTGEKTMIGLGALAALTIGGILVKRRLDVKAAEKLAKRASELLQKPEEFTKDTLKSIAAEWNNDGKLAAGDKIILMGKTLMDEFAAKNAKWSKLYKAMKMSDNGLMVVLQKADGKIDESTYKYFDPQKITYQLLSDSFKEGKIVELPIGSKN